MAAGNRDQVGLVPGVVLQGDVRRLSRLLQVLVAVYHCLAVSPGRDAISYHSYAGNAVGSWD